MSYTVYMHTFPNGRVYIGATSQKPERRWNSGKGYTHQTRMWRAIQEFGWEKIQHCIIACGQSKQAAYDLEKAQIGQYRSNEEEFGYNSSIGGQKGSLGAKRQPEHCKAMSERLKGKCPPKHVMKLAHQAKRDWHVPLETRKRMGDAQRGSKNHEYGKKKTNEQKLRVSLTLSRKPIKCVETGTIFRNTKEAAKAAGIKSGSNITVCCQGKRQTAGGYHWRYADE